jgi:hypothetical protein
LCDSYFHVSTAVTPTPIAAHPILPFRTVIVTIDKWITMRMTEANAVLIKYLRKELEDVLTDRFVDPKGRESKDRLIIDTVRRLLITDKNATVAF